jgi:hypothetical protein
LGLEFCNSNNAAEMAQILKSIHHAFVPKSSDSVQADILERIFLDGDQLTDE